MVSRFNIVGTIAVIVTLYASCLFAGEVDSNSSEETRPEVSCELKVRERYEFYDVEGKTLDELRKQMKKNGTKWTDGNVYSALTTWDIKYRYDIFNDNGRYSIKSVNTKVNIIYRLPRMTVAGTDPELTTLWNNYLARLQDHECGHKDIAVKAASEINEIFVSLAGFTSEDELEEQISLRTEEKFRQLKVLQIEYDDETRHGETQGAILPANDATRLAGA